MNRRRILIVDDDSVVLQTRAAILEAAGYEVTTALHGFDALLQLRSSIPDLIISDLNMPHMSGFELLSVIRRRFPQTLVIASSGAYDTGECMPGGLIADAFYAKGDGSPSGLLKLIAEVLVTPASRILERHSSRVPVWIPRNGNDSRGIPYIVVTCVDCLRSFPINIVHDDLQHVREAECLYCQTKMSYVVDFSREGIASEAANPPIPGAAALPSAR